MIAIPDARVEAIRWLICDAEVQQASGRVRGVRRTWDNPARVIVLNGVDLGHTAIDQLVGWEDLLSLCGPVNLMVARGLVPKMWADVAAVCAPRWAEADDPGHAAKIWFSRHPEEKARLDQIWKTDEVIMPWSQRPIQPRRESLGLSGTNHRHVWLARHVDLGMVRTSCAFHMDHTARKIGLDRILGPTAIVAVTRPCPAGRPHSRPRFQACRRTRTVTCHGILQPWPSTRSRGGR